jgi:hypothetical protein
VHAYDAVVIGADQAGLSASYHLRRLGIDHVSSTRRRRPFSPIPVPLATPSQRRPRAAALVALGVA